MIQEFVDKFMEKRKTLFKEAHPSYGEIVRKVAECISGERNGPDPERITEINHGNYHGTLVFVIAEKGYQPSTYWAVKINYGSCSGCDTLQAINKSWGDKPTEQEATEYQELALHIVQRLTEI